MMTAAEMYSEWRQAMMEGRCSKTPPMWFELPEEAKQAWDRLEQKLKREKVCVGRMATCGFGSRDIPIRDERAAHAKLEAKIGASDFISACTCGAQSSDAKDHLLDCKFLQLQESAKANAGS